MTQLLIKQIPEGMTPDGFIMDGPPNTAFIRIRDPLAAFVAKMEEKLRKNDHKTGWRDQPIAAHIRLLEIELMEFKVAFEFLDVERQKAELVDIANFAMIIHDKLSQPEPTVEETLASIRPKLESDIPF